MRIFEDVGRLFDGGVDLTVGIEEEFQILDGATLELTGRFAELKAAADARFGDTLVVGELICSEAEINSAASATFQEAREDMRRRRGALVEAAASLGLKLCATGVHPFSRWEEQGFIQTAHYRKVVDGLRYVAWTNNTFGLHVHVGVRGADRAVAVCDAYRSLLPPILALSASSPFFRGSETGLHSTRAQVFIRSFPRCGIPDAYGDWAGYADYAQFLYDTGSVTEPTQIWWTVRTHHKYGTLEIRIADAQPDFEDAMAIAALNVALAGALLEEYDRAGSLPVHATRFIEENRWRALRWGLGARLIDLDTRVQLPATEVIARLMDRAAASVGRLGLEGEMSRIETMLREGNSAQRQLEWFHAGVDLFEIHRRMVEQTMRVPGRAVS
ncbi:MAG: YbdK family carboxylate-amine ligase [Actinobacteria bacterium]|nr:YbdK family carboxylate-amine ligase [Actinomycetota bacterium]